MLTIYQKEISTFFNSLIGYLVIAVFLILVGVNTWIFSDTSVLDYGYADMSSLFSFGPLAFLFLIPAITMRSFAEEKKDGTLELLLTKPLSDWQLIWGKYLSGLTLVLFALIPTVVYYFSISNLGNPPGNIDTAAVITSYLGLLLLGAVFTSIGIFSSSIFHNQIVSFLISLVICYVMLDGVSRIASLDFWGNLSHSIRRLGLDYHYDALSKGVVDSRNVMYFLGIITLMLTATNLQLGSRKW
jgi:ABC-2 type transport system permease protein